MPLGGVCDVVCVWCVCGVSDVVCGVCVHVDTDDLYIDMCLLEIQSNTCVMCSYIHS